MVNCPACEETVNEDFGMVTCPHCKAVFMIDYSGKIEYGTEAAADVEEFEEEDDSTEEELEEPTMGGYDFPDPEEGDEESVGFDEPIVNDFPVVDVSDEDETEDNFGMVDELSDDEDSFDPVEKGPNEEDEVAGEEVSSAFESDFDDDLSGEAEKTNLAPDITPVDVTSFANSEESLLEGGEYRYTVTVSRIDSKDLRDDLKYVLMDEKLKLNHNEHIKNIVDGAVIIPDLHPIKAKRIVEQLQFFDLDVQWHQKRVIIEEPIEEEVYEELEEDEF